MHPPQESHEDGKLHSVESVVECARVYYEVGRLVEHQRPESQRMAL